MGEKGLEYLRGRLAYGNLLSKFVLETIDIDAGEAYVYIPEFVSIESTFKFKSGGKLEPQKSWRDKKEGVYIEVVPHLYSPVENEINRHLRQSAETICLLEDVDLSPTDSYTGNLSKKNYIFLNDDVYIFLQPEHAGTEKILGSLRVIPAFGIFNSFLTSFPPVEVKTLKQFEFMSEDLLRKFASRTEKIFTSAYDGESFIFWQKNV